jgi:hypothetical protein
MTAQPEAKTAHPAALEADAAQQLHAFHNTHNEAVRLFVMAAGQGATDTQIADALRKGLPHFTDPVLVAPPGCVFAAALGAIPADDWGRTWETDRTIMLRRTSKRVNEVVDKMRSPIIVKLSRTFLDVVCCNRERLQHILTRLEKMPFWCRITTLELGCCGMKKQDAGRLAGVLGQCLELSRLDLSFNEIGAQGNPN